MTTKDLYAPVNEQKNNDVSLGLKIPSTLRDKFNALCETRGVSMSLVLRRFIESQVAE